LETAPIAVEYWPVSQLVHTAAPVATLYFPATHNAQILPSAPVCPALQMQAICSLLASGALDCDGHDWHTFEIAPIAVE